MAPKKPKFNINAYYQNMSRILKGGSSVPHRIANKLHGASELGAAPVGTAAALMRNISTNASRLTSQYNNHTRISRIQDYSEMDTMAEIHSALDIYSHEVCSKDDYGDILKIESDDPVIKEALTRLFYDTLNIEFNAPMWVRSMCKFGDFFLLVDHNPDYGVINLFPIPVNEIEREESYDPDDPTAYRFRWTSHGNKILDSKDVVHFRLQGNDSYLPYGMSILEAARRAWRQLLLMEDAVMVYRIVRSPERRVFYFDVGNIPPNEVDQTMEKVKTNLKRSQIVDPTTGQVDLRYNPLSTDEDFYIPVRGQDSGTKIDTLPGGQFTGDIDDLNYIQNKLFAALKIPKSYLGYEGDVSGKSTLAQEDVRFADTIQYIQALFMDGLRHLAVIQLMSMGYRDNQLGNFRITMANPSTINEIQRLELWRTRFEVCSLATGQDGMLSKHFIYKKLFKLNDAEIAEIEEGRRADKAFDLELAAMEQRQQQEIAAEAQEDEAVEDAEFEQDDDDDTDDSGESKTDQQLAQRQSEARAYNHPHTQKAIPNDMKGRRKAKKRKKKRDSLVKRVYNTKKNGLDPRKDLNLMRKTATAAFGEHAEASDSIFKKQLSTLGSHTKLIKQLEKLYKDRDSEIIHE